MSAESLSSATFYLGAVVGFLLGVAFAVARRALADWRGAKEAVPKARKSFFTSVWETVKIGTLVLAGVLLFGWWAVRDLTGDRHPLTPAAVDPSASVSPTASPTRRRR